MASALYDEGAMASDSDLDAEDYYIVEDDNKSSSSEYVPCINYPNDKVYPENEKNVWVRLDEDTGPPNVYRFKESCFFSNFLSIFYKCFAYVFGQFAMKAIKLIKWIYNSELNCKYIYII